MRTILFFYVLLSFGFTIPSEEGAELRVLFQGLDVHEGKLAIELMDANEVRVKEYWLFVESETVELLIPDLLCGNYALRFFHDQNNSGHMDTNWLGIPTEAFGFSNDAKVVLGPPSIDKMIFNVQGPTEIIVNARRF